MFKFGFSSEEKEPQQDEDKTCALKTWLQCKEVTPPSDLNNYLQKIKEKFEINTIICDQGELQIKYLVSVNNNNFIEVLKEENLSFSDCILTAENNQSDLVTAAYEGGLKVWECTYDLLNYLSSDANLNFSEKNVLDLGCGAGIIGILCYLHGAKNTYFQDYNEEVLRYITIPNVRLNKLETVEGKCKFYSGDWKSFVNVLNLNDNDKFDYIFTSETIYNVDNYEKLHDVFQNCLKKTGTVFLAAKYHYFGVGGTLSEFEDLLKKKNVFCYTKCWECSEGLKRGILEIKFIT